MRERASGDAQHLLNKIGGKYSGQPVVRSNTRDITGGNHEPSIFEQDGKKKIVIDEARGSPKHNLQRSLTGERKLKNTAMPSKGLHWRALSRQRLPRNLDRHLG